MRTDIDKRVTTQRVITFKAWPGLEKELRAIHRASLLPGAKGVKYNRSAAIKASVKGAFEAAAEILEGRKAKGKAS